ncbi:UNVERIFIED_CONTAM: hypothetical protein FKN15_067115 [Acipenser sinensis]
MQQTDNDESGSEADWVCEDESSSSSDSEEDASEVPGLSARKGRWRACGRKNNPVAAPARMPATSPASAPAPDPDATSPEAATSPVVALAPPSTREAGNDGTVWNTINPGVEAAGIDREDKQAGRMNEMGECGTNGWQMLVNGLFFHLRLPPLTFNQILFLWSGSARLVHLVDLTVPWEDAVDEAYEKKKLRYAQLAAEAEQRGWRVRCRGFVEVEVGYRGFVAHYNPVS